MFLWVLGLTTVQCPYVRTMRFCFFGMADGEIISTSTDMGPNFNKISFSWADIFYWFPRNVCSSKSIAPRVKCNVIIFEWGITFWACSFFSPQITSREGKIVRDLINDMYLHMKTNLNCHGQISTSKDKLNQAQLSDLALGPWETVGRH